MFHNNDKELKKLITLSNCQHVTENTFISYLNNNIITLLALTPVCIVSVITTLLLIYSYNTSITLSHSCCLCCSKIIVIKSENICDIKKNMCCECCYKRYKLCKNVYKMFVKCCVCSNS